MTLLGVLMIGTSGRRPRSPVRTDRPRRWIALALVIASLWLAGSRPAVAQASSGAVVLVGGVLRFNQHDIWNRIIEQAADWVIIPAANDRPDLYGDFARRALQRHGAFAELLPITHESVELGVDHRQAVGDPVLVVKVREAAGIFFVGGTPQRLAGALFHPDGSPTPMGRAVADAHETGSVIVGGIPGAVGLATGLDALEVLTSGQVPPGQLHPGLGLMETDWFIDQHAFSAGRFAEILVAMHQLGVARGLGVGVDTAVTIEDGQAEVVGDEGVLLIDLSGSHPVTGAEDGFGLAGIRLSYLEHGDRFDVSTLAVTPAAVKLEGFEIVPGDDARQRSGQSEPVIGNLFAKGRLLDLLQEAVDGSRREASGFAFPGGTEEAQAGAVGFRFHFRAVAETAGWLSVSSGIERYTILNMALEVTPTRRRETPRLK